MRRALSLSQILESMPPPPHWRTDARGRPTCLTLAGKDAVAYCQQQGLSIAVTLNLIGLYMRDEEFAEFRTRSSIVDPDLHRKHRDQKTALAAGTWKPSWVGRATNHG